MGVVTGAPGKQGQKPHGSLALAKRSAYVLTVVGAGELLLQENAGPVLLDPPFFSKEKPKVWISITHVKL